MIDLSDLSSDELSKTSDLKIEGEAEPAKPKKPKLKKAFSGTDDLIRLIRNDNLKKSAVPEKTSPSGPRLSTNEL